MLVINSNDNEVIWKLNNFKNSREQLVQWCKERSIGNTNQSKVVLERNLRSWISRKQGYNRL